MNGKATCAILKQIRRDIAEKNDIALTIEECTYQGSCSGTCPPCEAEVRVLERALAEKKKRGIKTAVAGISAGLLAAGLISCTPVSAESGSQNSGVTGGPAGTQVTEADGNNETEAVVPDGLLDPDFMENRDGGEFPLEGEPPVTDYCPEDGEDGEDDAYMLEGDVLAPEILPEDEEEYPEFAGIMPAPDLEQEQP